MIQTDRQRLWLLELMAEPKIKLWIDDFKFYNRSVVLGHHALLDQKYSRLLKLEVKPWLNNPSLWPVTGLSCGGWGRDPGEHGALTGLINSDSVTHIPAPADQWPLYTQTDHTHGARSRHRTRTLASGCPSLYQVLNASLLLFLVFRFFSNLFPTLPSMKVPIITKLVVWLSL